MAPKLNRLRALFVLGRIDEILSWERTTKQVRDTRFVASSAAISVKPAPDMGIPLTIVEAVLGSSYFPVAGPGGGPAPRRAPSASRRVSKMRVGPMASVR